MKIICKNYLQKNPNEIFVFGDNLLRKGLGGAASLRYEPNVYGFITKKYPSNNVDAFYATTEYITIYKKEISNLIKQIKNNPDKIFLISRLGAGLANKFGIFEQIIELNIRNDLAQFQNIEFLW